MFDNAKFENTPKYKDFTYWFRRKSENTFISFMKDDRDKILHEISVNDDDSISSETEPLVDVELMDFTNYQNRPEYLVGKSVVLNADIPSNNQEYMVDNFETLIAGSIFIRAYDANKDPDSVVKTVFRLLDWIRSTDFYFCPGSTRFHHAFPCGLMYHSLDTYNNIVDLRNLKKFQNTRYDSITLVSLCHDFTKIGNYESYMRNVKDEHTGQWNQVSSYRWKCNPFPFGHGVSSMYIITQFIHLDIEELLAIRWHMGEYSVSSNESGELEDACDKYPLVRMIQFADQLSCTQY